MNIAENEAIVYLFPSCLDFGGTQFIIPCLEKCVYSFVCRVGFLNCIDVNRVRRLEKYVRSGSNNSVIWLNRDVFYRNSASIMGIRIIHTSDLHLDKCFSGTGMSSHFGNRRRQSLRDVFQSIIRRCKDWPADVLLIAGDLFEQDRITRDTVAFLVSQFSSIPNTLVFIAPGNHDPCIQESPYLTENWPENVHVYSVPMWESVKADTRNGEVFVHGFGFDSPYLNQNPFGHLLIDHATKSAVHVAVAHGSEKSRQPPDKEDYAPFTAQEAAAPGLNYLALGHFHSFQMIDGQFDTKVCYSGSPEGLSFKEFGVHGYVEVEIDGKQTSITAVPSSQMVYLDESIACDEFKSSQEVVEAIRDLAKSVDAKVIGRIRLTGTCEACIQNETGLIYDAAAIEFEYLDLIDDTAPVEDFEELARENTSLGALVSVLNKEIAETGDRSRTQMLIRARELGVAAFRDRNVEIHGLERG